MAPSEFWRMSPQEFWRICDARSPPPTVGTGRNAMRRDTFDELVAMLPGGAG